MPTVPRYQQQVRPAPLPRARLSSALTPAAAGVGVAQAEGDLAATVETGKARVAVAGADIASQISARSTAYYGDLMLQEQRQADETAVLESTTVAGQGIQAFLWDPDKGAYYKKRKDAMALPETANAEFERITAEAGAGLNSRQRRAYDLWRVREYERFTMGIARHVSEQSEVHKAEVAKAAIELAANEAIRNYQEPKVVVQQMNFGAGIIRSRGKAMGLGSDEIELAVQGFTSSVHAGAIQNLVADNKVEAARQWLESGKDSDQIDPKQYDNLKKLVDGGDIKKQAQGIAEAALKAGATLTEWRMFVRNATEKDDPTGEKRDQAMAYVEHEQNVKDKIEADQLKADLAEGFNVLDAMKVPSIAALAGTPVWIRNPELRPHWRTYAKQKESDAEPDAGGPTFYAQMMAVGKNAQKWAAETDLNLYRTRLSKAEFHQLASMQTDILMNQGKQAEKDIAGFSSNEKILEATLSQAGFSSDEIAGNKGANQARVNQVFEIRRLMNLQVGLLQQGFRAKDGTVFPPKKADDADVQKALDTILVASVTTPGRHFWSSDVQKRVIELTIDDVPADKKAAIERKLRREKVVVGPQQAPDYLILDLYIKDLLFGQVSQESVIPTTPTKKTPSGTNSFSGK